MLALINLIIRRTRLAFRTPARLALFPLLSQSGCFILQLPTGFYSHCCGRGSEPARQKPACQEPCLQRALPAESPACAPPAVRAGGGGWSCPGPQTKQLGGVLGYLGSGGSCPVLPLEGEPVGAERLEGADLGRWRWGWALLPPWRSPQPRVIPRPGAPRLFSPCPKPVTPPPTKLHRGQQGQARPWQGGVGRPGCGTQSTRSPSHRAGPPRASPGGAAGPSRRGAGRRAGVRPCQAPRIAGVCLNSPSR